MPAKNNGLWLAMDTTTENLALALRLPDGSVKTSSEIVWRDQSTRLHPQLAALFAEANTSPLALNGIIATCGPGSFTSIRIGIAAAKALAYAAGCPTVALTTTEVLAAPWAGKTVHVWLEASSDQVHQHIFNPQGEPMAAPQTVPADSAIAQLQSGDVVVGNAVLNRRDRLPAGVHAPDETHYHYPQPQLLLARGLARFEAEGASPLDAVYVQALSYRKVGA